jgi:hypothetical protein
MNIRHLLDISLKIGNNGNPKTNFIFWNFKDQEKQGQIYIYIGQT